MQNILTESESQILQGKKMEIHPIQRKLELVRAYQSYEAIEALHSTFYSPANGHEMSMHEIAFKAQVQICTVLNVGKMARDVAFRHQNDALEKHILENRYKRKRMIEKFNNDMNRVEKNDVQESLDVAYTMLSLGK